MRVRVAFFALALSANMGMAGPVDDAIVKQLQEQGYTAVDVRKTLLGRIRIIAANQNRVREIILNPNSGEILRDYSSRRNRLVEPLLRGIENNQNRSGYGGTGVAQDRGQAEDTPNTTANTVSRSTATASKPAASETVSKESAAAKGDATSSADTAAKSPVSVDPVSDAAAGADAPSD